VQQASVSLRHKWETNVEECRVPDKTEAKKHAGMQPT
jgi:hypothetical protein